MPYFSKIYFQCFGANFGHFFEADGKTILGIHYHKRKNFVSMANEEITRDLIYVAKYGHPAKYGSLLCMFKR